MTITIPPALEIRLVAKAKLAGKTPEELALDGITAQVAEPPMTNSERLRRMSHDERMLALSSMAIACGVSYPDHILSSETYYE